MIDDASKYFDREFGKFIAVSLLESTGRAHVTVGLVNDGSTVDQFPQIH
jgi:hypothetical protein